ncbi:MAG: SUF system Fe-S cluster assembly protein [Pseudomonadota bacterium]|nr:SUF system Fe-S cluster assembly protein [Pseudomonadota bacterium]
MAPTDKLDEFGQAFVTPPGASDDDTSPPPGEAEDAPVVAGEGDVTLRGEVIEALKTVYDPEIPVNIYDLGLIYRIDIDTANCVALDMTLTSPNCPVAESLPGWVETAAKDVPGVSAVQVALVWDPPWDQERMTEAARLELGLF